MPVSISDNYGVVALGGLLEELPVLVGEENWPSIKKAFEERWEQLQEMTEPTRRAQLLQELLDIFTPYEAAHLRFKEILSVMALRSAMQDITPLVNGIGLDPSAINSSVEIALHAMSADVELLTEARPSQRHITIRWGGIGLATSVKISNLQLGFGEMTELAAETIMGSSDIVGYSNPLIVSAAVLLAIRTLTKTITVRISETETSVFWGFILVRDEQNMATQAEITQETNNQREKQGLDPLTNKQVREALYKLKAMKSVEKVARQPDRWKIIETFNIRG